MSFSAPCLTRSTDFGLRAICQVHLRGPIRHSVRWRSLTWWFSGTREIWGVGVKLSPAIGLLANCLLTRGQHRLKRFRVLPNYFGHLLFFSLQAWRPVATTKMKTSAKFAIIDTLFNYLLFTPLVLLFWYGTYALIDVIIIAHFESRLIAAILTFVIGLYIEFAVTYWQVSL